MIDATVQNRTGLSPEWDRWFDEQFADLIATDEELLRAEFDDLMSSSWPQPPSSPSPPAAPSANSPTSTPPKDAADSSSPRPGPSDQPPTRPPPDS
ncbi:hypothetical protein [Actinoplanes sp. NPDC051411]|uniref:hypothetical protein n=1 Tax=Actinoplanes sp. NPDC051411 TaxID=3155522 RepID=UPI00342611DA